MSRWGHEEGGEGGKGGWAFPDNPEIGIGLGAAHDSTLNLSRAYRAISGRMQKANPSAVPRET